MVNNSGSTKPPAHREDGDGGSSETSENLDILTRLSARGNFSLNSVAVKVSRLRSRKTANRACNIKV